MGQEIEKKFLVKCDIKSFAHSASRIVQRYLSSVPERIVRVRIIDNKGYLTIKGIGNQSGVSRYEWEKEISVQEANELLQICESGEIDKTRYKVRVGTHIFEVDEFYGDNQGLTLAELELSSEDEVFEKPVWLGKEVTGDIRYYNSMLMKKPFKTWSEK
jgi:adenylate cyclase